MHADPQADRLKARLTALQRPEITVIMDRLLERARQEQEWGTPPILDACLAVVRADLPQGARLAAFLADRPASQITAGIVPKIADQPWALNVFQKWRDAGVSPPVKAAITRREKNGDIAV